MPRIAVAVAVVAIVGVSIGINVARFPTVWEMAGQSATASPSRESASGGAPAPSEPIADLSQVAPPETYGLPRADSAPIRPIASEPIALPGGAEASAGVDEPSDSAPSLEQGKPAARLISSSGGALPGPIEGGSALAGLSDETRGDSPAFGSDHASQSEAPPTEKTASATTNPSALGDASDQTRWPAEASASMRFAAKPAPPAELSPWQPKKALVPVDWGSEPEEDPTSRVLLTSDGRRMERLPPIDTGGE
ncbi:MAG: hypothetical protein JW809_17165 [Pirellulales bacterium]|nr:hypothetical protein [Pirellulales bacterium]